jgi:hypothetical protein
MDILSFIDSNTWTDGIDENGNAYQYLIDWSAKDLKEFTESAKQIESMEDTANVIDDYAYFVIHSITRFKHIAIKRYKI